MKKRALLLTILLIAGFQLINHFVVTGQYFGLALAIEKLLATVIVTCYCWFYIRKQAHINIYSYKLMVNLGVLIFLLGTVVNQLYRLFFEYHEFGVAEVYVDTIRVFSQNVYLVLPLVLILAGMLIVSNLALIKHDGYKAEHTLGIILGILLLGGSFVGTQLFGWLQQWISSGHNLMTMVAFFVETGICLTISYFECMLLAAVICTLKSERYQPPLDQKYVIILGCKMDKDGSPLPILQGRIERALTFGQKQQTATGLPLTYVPAGGQGKDEVITEAQAMKNYLVAKGVDKKQIWLENKSKTTRENMKFAKKVIEQKGKLEKVIFATTGYHVWRSGVIANNVGLNARGIGAKAPWYFYQNALVRELAANLYVQQRQHFFNLVFLHMCLIMMLAAGFNLGVFG
ncbi:YdcF family protein [bacterium]|nr:YdcF family protein [bacterium]